MTANDNNIFKAVQYRKQGERSKKKKRYKDAVKKFQRALEIDRETGQLQDMVIDLNALAGCYERMDQFDKAEQTYRESIAIHKSKDIVLCDEYIETLYNVAELYTNNGHFNQAIKFYLQSINAANKLNGHNHYTIANKLNSLGSLYLEICNYYESELCLTRALKIAESKYGSNHIGISDILISLSLLYSMTGRYALAETYAKRSIAIITHEHGTNHTEAAMAFTTLAEVYMGTRDYDKAELFYKKTLKIVKKHFYDTDTDVVSWAMSNLAEVYRCKDDYKKFIRYLERAKRIRGMDAGVEHLDALLTNLGWGYQELGKYKKAEAFHRQSLPIAEKTGNQNLVLLVQYGLSRLYLKTGQSSTAIYFGKKAANTIQDIRANISKIGKDVLQTYQVTVEAIFKHLAGLLIDEGRFTEAEQVTNLLKSHEYFEYIRRDAAYANEFLVKVAFTSAETLCDELYRGSANKLVELMRGQEASGERSHTLQLDGKLETAKNEFQTTIDHICKILTDAPKEQRIIHGDEESSELMEILKELGNDAVALYPFSTEETFHLLLVNNKGRREIHRYAIRESALRQKIYDFRQTLTLKGGKYDPQALAQELYRIVLGQSADELRNLKVKTLLWSLEGSLRYIPIAALHDGEKYLVESFSNVMFTPASKSRLTDDPRTTWKGLGLGVTKDHPPFAALPSVENELKGIISFQNAGDFIFDGTVKLDKNFTWKSMCGELKRKYPLVHIASHFQCTPGNDTTSFLLLGDGQRVTMDKIRSQDNLFKGVDLLTLSACNTAVGNVGQDGKEVECFGVLAQRQGAKAIIASLWPVADISTSILMKEFYRQRVAGKTKAEALREAQVALLQGRIKPEKVATTIARTSSTMANAYDQNSPATCSELFDFESDEDKPFAHPYFWAPFILIGNWK